MYITIYLHNYVYNFYNYCEERRCFGFVEMLYFFACSVNPRLILEHRSLFLCRSTYFFLDIVFKIQAHFKITEVYFIRIRHHDYFKLLVLFESTHSRTKP